MHVCFFRPHTYLKGEKHMDKEAMKTLILESLSRKLGSDCRISIQKVLKTNLRLDALVILQDGKNCFPTIYLEPFYEELEKGAAVDAVTDSIISSYFHAMSDIQSFDVSPIADFNYAKERLYVELINRHSNTELLQDIPHSTFLDDFAIVIRCLVDMTPNENERANFLVHNGHMKLWDTDQETLLSAAVQNTRKLFGTDLRNMNEFLGELLGCPANDNPQPPIWVMSNRHQLSGAATVLFDDVLKEFADVHGSFYVIFSSVHEVLLIPADSSVDIDALTRINHEVNASQVRADEVLGTHAYFYDKGKGFVF